MCSACEGTECEIVTDVFLDRCFGFCGCCVSKQGNWFGHGNLTRSDSNMHESDDLARGGKEEEVGDSCGAGTRRLSSRN